MLSPHTRGPSTRPFKSRAVRASTRGVLEGALVRAAAAELVGQRRVVHAQELGVVLPARAIVARDHTRDGRRVLHRVGHPHGDVVAGAEPPLLRVVLDLDGDGAHAERPARLPRPGEVNERLAAPRAGEDRLQRRPLALVRALVEVEEEVPGRAGLVVVVMAREHGREAGEVDLAAVPALDRPRQRALADAVGRPPAGLPVDAPARADDVAVAGLEVGAGDVPFGVLAHRAATSGAATACLRYWCTKAIAMLPSPTAAATRLTGPKRTSPHANTPGTLVSSR